MGFLWFGTQDGLNVYDGKKIKIFRYDPDDPGSLVSNYLRCSCEDKYGNLWFGTNEGLCRYRREKNDFEVFINDSNDIKGYLLKLKPLLKYRNETVIFFCNYIS